MFTIEQYKIEESIRDVIGILDSAPIQNDMIEERNIVQLTNRAPIAHLAIERGMKALIKQAGGVIDHTHSLHKLYLELMKYDLDCTDYLSEAFEDAVKFFGYNFNVKGFGQFRSLGDYLSKVGGEKAFDELRYWAIGEFDKSNSPISYISLPIHRELLCALECLSLSGFRQTVSQRVVYEVKEALSRPTRLAYGVGDLQRENSINWYINWLKTRGSWQRAIEEAVDSDFVIRNNDDVVTQILREAFDELKASKDPAAQYYISTLTYLPKGSQRRNPDATPEFEWLGQGKVNCKVSTPAGTCLGFMDKYANGAWGIQPQENGLVRITDIAWHLSDAKHYLVNRLTRQISVTTRGKRKQLRIVSDKDFFPVHAEFVTFQVPADLDPNRTVYDLEFWDAEHGLCLGDEVQAELQTEEHPGVVSILEGKIVKVSEQIVSISGTNYFASNETSEEDS